MHFCFVKHKNKECIFMEKLKRRKDGRAVKKVMIEGEDKPKYFYSSKKSDREANKDINQQMIAYQQKLCSKRSFKAVADDWNTDYRLRVPETTYKKHIKASYKRVLEYFKDVGDISEIESADVDAFIKTIINKQYSKKTVATHKSIVSMIFDYAIMQRYIKYNPVSIIRLPNGLPQEERELPTTEEMREINKHTEGFDLLPFMILNTGLRKSEILAIKDFSIERKSKLIDVSYHVIHDDNRPIYEKKTKTKKSERKAYLLDKVLDALPENFTGFLFSMNGDGKEPLTQRAFDCRWENYCKKYGLNITSHQLRHGFATMCFEAGLTEKEAQELLGHADIKTTMDIYTHIRKEYISQSVSKLNDFEF